MGLTWSISGYTGLDLFQVTEYIIKSRINGSNLVHFRLYGFESLSAYIMQRLMIDGSNLVRFRLYRFGSLSGYIIRSRINGSYLVHFRLYGVGSLSVTTHRVMGSRIVKTLILTILRIG